MQMGGADPNAPDRADKDWASWAGLAFIAVAFGSVFYFNSLALRHFPVSVVGAARVVLVAVTLVPVSLILGQTLPKGWASWRWAAAYGFVGMLIPFYLLVWSQTTLPTNVTSAFFASIPLMILFFSRVLLGVTITLRKLLGLFIGSAGLVYLAGPGTFAQIGDAGLILPQLAMLGACACFAINSIIIRKMPKAPPLPMTAAAGSVAGLFVLPPLISGWPAGVPPAAAIAGLLGAGVFSTALGLSVRFWLIRRRGPVFVTPNGYLAAMVGATIGVVLLGEEMAGETVLAFAIILAGLLMAEDGSGRMKQA